MRTFALLFGFALVPASVHAGSGSVTFEVCNMGQIDIDVLFMQKSTPSETHVRPATCQTVARADGAMEPATVGIAFVDARGQWGAARRFDYIPHMGRKTPPLGVRLAELATKGRDSDSVEVLSAATGTQSVRRGNAMASLPMQLLFQPRFPECRQAGTGNSSTQTIGRRTTTIIEVVTICEELGYTLKVEAHPDSREASLGAQPVAGAMSGTSATVNLSGKVPVDWVQEAAERKERDAPHAVDWRSLIAGLQLQQRRDDDARRGSEAQRRSAGYERVMPDHIALRGTVASVEIDQRPVDATTVMPVAQIFFRESPDDTAGPSGPAHPEFNVCTGRLDILQDLFGADYRTSMVGKVIEVQGSLGHRFLGVMCSGRRGSLALVLARQLRTVPSPQFPAGTRAWTAPPPAAQPPRALTAAEVEQQITMHASVMSAHVRVQAALRMSKACTDQMEKAKAASSADDGTNLYQYQKCKVAVRTESEKEGQRAFECARDFIRADPNSDTRDPEGFRRRVDACALGTAAPPPAAPVPVRSAPAIGK